MILQALTEYYRALEQKGKIAAPGWAPVKVSYALLIDGDGALKQAVSVQTEQMRGKKAVACAARHVPPRAREADGRRGRQFPL